MWRKKTPESLYALKKNITRKNTFVKKEEIDMSSPLADNGTKQHWGEHEDLQHLSSAKILSA